VKLTTNQCWSHKVMVILVLFVKLVVYIPARKGKGKELKVPHYASAAATRDNYATHSRQYLRYLYN